MLIHDFFFMCRRTFGGRKLWESKDDKKWGHDKFEELTMQERHYEEVTCRNGLLDDFTVHWFSTRQSFSLFYNHYFLLVF